MRESEKLRRLLAAGGYTQQHLADRIGVSFVSLNAWANGRAKPRARAVRIIDGLLAELALSSPLDATSFVSASDVERAVAVPRLTDDQLEQLVVGESDASTIDVLRESQYVQLLKNLSGIVSNLGDYSFVKAALLLDQAKRKDSEACKQALLYPTIPIWSAVCFRSLLGVVEDSSMADHLRHFSAVAAVAAWRSGVRDFSIEVAVHAGFVALPSLGRAVVCNEDDVESAQLVCKDGVFHIELPSQVVEIPSDVTCETLHWEPVRSIVTAHADLELRLVIDDVDPYRTSNTGLPLSATHSRLDQLEFKALTEQVQEAWAKLAEHHVAYAKGMARALRVLVPIRDEPFHTTAFYPDGFGIVATTLGASSSWMARGMLEECQRMKVHVLNLLDRLHTARIDGGAYLLAFTGCPVPFECLIGTFYASAAMAHFWGAEYRSAVGAEQLEAAIQCEVHHLCEISLYYQLVESGELTALGRRLVTMLRERDKQPDRDRPIAVTEAARDMVIDYRLGLRLRFVVCDHDDIERLASAWITGQSCPLERPVREFLKDLGRPSRGRKRRRQLRELRLAHPERFDDLLKNEAFLDIVVPGATRADALAVAGMFDEAVTEFTQAIVRDDRDADAWEGLAFVCARSGNEAMLTMGRFPELVGQLHTHLRNAHGLVESPLVLARWLEPLLISMNDSDVDGESYVFDGRRHED